MKIKFNLESFEPVPEGERVLEIVKAECKPSGKPTQMNVSFKDIETGKLLSNRYDFGNQGAINAMGILCRFALDIPDMGEFDTVTDTKKLIGKHIIAEVVHTEGTQEREDGTYPIFANIKKVIGGTEAKAEKPTSARASIPVGDDLD